MRCGRRLESTMRTARWLKDSQRISVRITKVCGATAVRYLHGLLDVDPALFELGDRALQIADREHYAGAMSRLGPGVFGRNQHQRFLPDAHRSPRLAVAGKSLTNSQLA